MEETPLGAEVPVPKPSIEADSPTDTSATKNTNGNEVEAKPKSPGPQSEDPSPEQEFNGVGSANREQTGETIDKSLSANTPKIHKCIDDIHAEARQLWLYMTEGCQSFKKHSYVSKGKMISCVRDIFLVGEEEINSIIEQRSTELRQELHTARDEMLAIFADAVMDNEGGAVEKAQNIDGRSQIAEDMEDKDAREYTRALLKKRLFDFREVAGECTFEELLRLTSGGN